MILYIVNQYIFKIISKEKIVLKKTNKIVKFDVMILC